jgi:hypothetical protein
MVFVLLSSITTGQTTAFMNTAYSVKGGVIYCDRGIPASPRWFADSRLAFSFDEAGISQVDYYNPGDGQNLSTLFLRQLWDGFRYFLEKNSRTYKPEYTNSRIHPFGIESEWMFGNDLVKHRVMAIDESIVIQITLPAGVATGLQLKMEFFEAFGLTRGAADDLRYAGDEKKRKWEPWKFSTESNILESGVLSDASAGHASNNRVSGGTYCIIGADFPLTSRRSSINARHTLKSPVLEAGKTYSFCISFGPDRSETIKKNQQLIDSLTVKIRLQQERYRRVAANSPVLESPYPALNNFISLAPVYHESLKIKDRPGALRAKTSNYWVWGWDGMTSNYATAYWGDPDHIKNMLEFYETTADSTRGIAHAFGFDMKPGSFSALPAQGMYISLLQLYYANTADLHVLEKRYPFAKKIFNRIAKSEVAGTGFCAGSSLFPDFPEAMGETGHDISGFNNTIFYCAARSMESLAALMGDHEQQKKALQIIRRFEHNFATRFFNKQKKFIVSSIDSKTLEQRDSYTTNSIRWENNYCADITDELDADCLQFFIENAVTPMGLREIPLWNKSYDGDANQLHCWWPVTGEFFMRLINRNDQKQLVDQWINWVSYWTNNLTCPEGISYYLETDQPEFDRWTSQKGTWQAYSMRGWYQAALHGVVGVGTDLGGLTFYPYSGAAMTLKGLNYQRKKFDIAMQGSGSFISSVVVDGMPIRATNKLPADCYVNKDHIGITVTRTPVNPYPVSIISGNAIELLNYHYEREVITAGVTGAGLCRLKLRASRLPVVKWNGRKIPVIYHADQHTASVELTLKPGITDQIEIH